METRYFLNPDGSLRAETGPGRCARYWELYQKHLLVTAELKALPREIQRQRAAEMERQAATALEMCHTHLEICDQCRCWLDLCDEISQKTCPVLMPVRM